jgi:hypothetical protein
MKTLVVTFVMIDSGIFVLNSAAWAQDSDSGKSEFQSSSATCHGIDGERRGPLSTQLKVLPADLTVLTKKNNGVFPFETVYEAIGRCRLRVTLAKPNSRPSVLTTETL